MSILLPTVSERRKLYGLGYPRLIPNPEHLFDRKEMYHAPLLLPQVVVIDHVRPLTAEHPDVLGMVVASVAVDVMHNFTGQQRTTQLPLGHRPVFVVVLTCPGVRALLIAG